MVSTPEEYSELGNIKSFESDVVKSKKCKFCGSDKIVKWGKKNNKQTYKCKACGHRFYMNETFVKMRYKGEVIAKAIDLYYDGLSVRKVRKQLRKMFDINVSWQTVWNWIQKYSKLVKTFTNNLKPDFGEYPVWHCDETVLGCNGNKRWYWDAIDSRTRFLINTHISKARGINDTVKFFKNCKSVSARNPCLVITDSMNSYHKAFNKVFFKKDQSSRHMKYKDFKAQFNNNKIERFHGTLKDRTRVMRGLGDMETAKITADGFCIHYNFVRTHEGLDDRTPAQASNINLPFEDGWGDLIYWSTVYKTKNA